MKPTVVKVPGPLLLDPDLAASAKLLWMVLHLEKGDDEPTSPGLLEARSGLSRNTVLQGMQRLTRAGWLNASQPGPNMRGQASASVPSDLLLDHQVGVQARVLYGTLQLTPHFRSPTGQFTYGELSQRIGVSSITVKDAVMALQQKGWLGLSQANKFSPIRFTLCNPVAERREGAVAEATRRLERAAFVGEALMREYLSLIIDSHEFDDDASPGFLVNPLTGEEMQFDRYYPPSVAFEFNGPQHYGPTEKYPDEAVARKQQGRDYIKMGICASRGIRLVVLHPADLTLDVMRQQVEGLLPLRDLDGHEPRIAYLESVSRSYRRRARRGR